MFLSGLSFVAVNATVRHLGTDLPAAESAFIRFAYGLLFLLPSLVAVLRNGVPRAAVRLVLGRGALHTMAVILWFFAMARIPLAEVTAIGYLNPIVVTVGAALFLGERIALRRVLAIAVALIGALVVLRPGLREIVPGHFAQLGAATCFGLSYIIAKRLSAMFSASAMVALLSLTVSLSLVPFAAAVWVTPTTAQMFWLAVVALFATFGHYSMGRAFAAAPVTVTQPVIFLQLVWATILGALAFGEAVDPFVLLGGGMIIGAITYITFREARLRRRVTAPAPEAANL